jgi:hypothetical protein
MALKSLISIVLAGAALTVGAQAAFAMSDASDRATQSQVGLYPDAIERAVNAKLAAQSTVNRYPDVIDRAVNAKLAAQSTGNRHSDAVDRAVVNRVQSGALSGHIDRYELDLPNGPVAAATTGSGREIEWPQVGIGFGIGMLLLLGLILAVRFTRSRPFAHG